VGSKKEQNVLPEAIVESFHSISFPSEWGAELGASGDVLGNRFHSISFPSEWGAKGDDRVRGTSTPFPFN
jgi:hypothetical protein